MRSGFVVARDLTMRLFFTDPPAVHASLSECRMFGKTHAPDSGAPSAGVAVSWTSWGPWRDAGAFRRNARTNDSRRLATWTESGNSRRITRTAKPPCRQRLYWYTQRASVSGGPTSAISENKQKVPARGGEIMRWGY
jgi:hypothetical protein